MLTAEYNNKILVVDDQPEIIEDYLKILLPKKDTNKVELASLEAAIFGNDNSSDIQEAKVQENTYVIDTASQGEEALDLIKKSLSGDNSYAVAFIDVRMPPGMDGVHTAHEIQKIDPNLQIVFVTAYSDFSRKNILNLVKFKDKCFFVRKPFDADELKQFALALTEKWNLTKLLKEKNSELFLTRTITIRALAQLAELRDTDTGGHLKRVAAFSKLIASELKKLKEPRWCNYISNQYIKDLEESSILHDIGKVGIPDSILLKPGKLDKKEFDLMKSHTKIGGDALAKAVDELPTQTFLTLGREIAYYHHEKFDGSGYNEGLKGEDIPLSARIVALADVYDALTSDRPYRSALSHEDASKIIIEEMGVAHFDPVIFDIFKKNDIKFKQIRIEIS